MTIISNSITLHRKPKDGKDGTDGTNGVDGNDAYLAQLSPAAIDIAADMNGLPIFQPEDQQTPEIALDLATANYGFAASTAKVVSAAQYPNYHTYMSTNKGVDNSGARMRIRFRHVKSLKLVYSSYAESQYDYLMLSKLDTALPDGVNYSHSSVAYHTRNNQTADIANEAVYEVDNVSVWHFIDVLFLKDSSAASNDDRGYIAIPDVSVLPAVKCKTFTITPRMQNAGGNAVIDYNDPRLSLPEGCGLTYQRTTPLLVSVQEGTVVKPSQIVVPVKDEGGKGGTQIAELPVRVSYGGKNVDTITVSASCHDGTQSNGQKCYVEINGKRIGKTKVFTYTWDAANHGFVRNVEHGKEPLTYYTGFACYYIDADTLECLEVDYLNTYSAGNVASTATDEQITALADAIRGVTGWYIKETTTPVIMVMVAADASGCNAAVRRFLNDYGGSLSTTYVPDRYRHYFVTNIRTARSGQAYEEISRDPTQKIVTFTVNRGDGVVLQGVQGSQGGNGFDGCLIRRSEWESGKVYRNDSARTERDPVTGQFIIDEVTVSDYDGGNGYTYICKQTHTSSSSNKPPESLSSDNDPNWRKVESRDSMRISFADIQHAIIDYLQARQIVITETDASGNPVPYGAFGGGTAWPLWFGAPIPEQAVTRVNRDGHLYSQRFITEGQDAHVEISDGLLSVFGKEASPNIVFGVDENGFAVLKYYSGGVMLYNLGPQGIMSQVTETHNKMSVGLRMLKAFDGQRIPSTFTTVTPSTLDVVYQFVEGFKKVGELLRYKIGNVIGSTPDYTRPSSSHNCYYTSRSLTPYSNDYDGDGHTDVFTWENGKPDETTKLTRTAYFTGKMLNGNPGVGTQNVAYEAFYFTASGRARTFFLYISKSTSSPYVLCDASYNPIGSHDIDLNNYLSLTDQPPIVV